MTVAIDWFEIPATDALRPQSCGHLCVNRLAPARLREFTGHDNRQTAIPGPSRHRHRRSSSGRAPTRG